MGYEGKERDQKWAHAIHRGDHSAFEALFRTYAERLCAFAAQYVESPEVAEEIVQDIFLKIWQRRQDWRPRTNVRAYLYKTVRNQALDYLKHEQVVAEWKRQAGAEEMNAPSLPDENLRRKELSRAVQEAIAELPERRRLIFTLSRQHDMTYREIAETLDISIKTVETQMSRAFRLFREHLVSFLPTGATER